MSTTREHVVPRQLTDHKELEPCLRQEEKQKHKFHCEAELNDERVDGDWIVETKLYVLSILREHSGNGENAEDVPNRDNWTENLVETFYFILLTEN